MVAFRKQSAELLLGITRSVDLAQKQLVALPTGGRTPLGAGLLLAQEVLRAAAIRDKDILPVLVLITDGRANASVSSDSPVNEALACAGSISSRGIRSIVVDTEKSFIRLKLAEQVAEALCADYFRIEELNAELLSSVVSCSIGQLS
jgi:magnesium chelatase subunit D